MVANPYHNAGSGSGKTRCIYYLMIIGVLVLMAHNTNLPIIGNNNKRAAKKGKNHLKGSSSNHNKQEDYQTKKSSSSSSSSFSSNVKTPPTATTSSSVSNTKKQKTNIVAENVSPPKDRSSSSQSEDFDDTTSAGKKSNSNNNEEAESYEEDEDGNEIETFQYDGSYDGSLTSDSSSWEDLVASFDWLEENPDENADLFENDLLVLEDGDGEDWIDDDDFWGNVDSKEVDSDNQEYEEEASSSAEGTTSEE